MTLMRWNPWDELNRLREEINRLMENAPVPGWLRGGEWQPNIDVLQSDGEIIVKADLPGIAPKDVDVRIFPDAVTIKGETSREEETQRENYYHRERRYGAFFRQVRLPVAVKAEEAQATFKNGLLEVRVPKADTTAGQGHKVELE